MKKKLKTNKTTCNIIHLKENEDFYMRVSGDKKGNIKTEIVLTNNEK